MMVDASFDVRLSDVDALQFRGVGCVVLAKFLSAKDRAFLGLLLADSVLSHRNTLVLNKRLKLNNEQHHHGNQRSSYRSAAPITPGLTSVPKSSYDQDMMFPFQITD